MRVIGNPHFDPPAQAQVLDIPSAPAVLARFDAEIARVHRLSDQALEALCTIIDGNDAFDVVRKLYRFVSALACPTLVLGRMFVCDPGGFNRFCLQLVGYRDFLTRLEQGASPRDAAMVVARIRRDWLGRELGAYSEEPEDEPVDVYDAEGELDPGAVRAEIDCLLRHLNVAPERVGITILPDGEVA